MRRILVPSALAFLTLVAQAIAAPMSSANYQIPISVVASGGSPATTATYQMTATIGQPVIGPTASPSTNLYAGFIASWLVSISLTRDINGDGVVDIRDVQMLLQICLGARKATDGIPENGDINGDGSIRLDDASQVMHYLNGLQPTLP